MSINSLSPLTNTYIQSLLSTQLSSAVSTANGSANGINAASLLGQQDNNNLSPFAQVLTTLQQLQQSNPTEYQQVTQQIATNLQSAAQTATSDGNTQAAANLTQLSTDFQNASQSGQLPNVQDLAKAIGGGHHHGHHHHAASSTTDTDGDATSSNSTGPSSIATADNSTTGGLSQLLSSLLSTSNTTQSLNPTSIIRNTLQNAGIQVNS